VDGFVVADSPTFIIVELLLNVTITLDFLARVKLEGFRKYLKKSNWNKLDFSICFGCNLLFVVSLVSHAIFEEMSEELLLVFWSIAQSLRMIVIARKQR